jgi:hypothetical protein
MSPKRPPYTASEDGAYCTCGHKVESHKDERDEWTACAQCGCIGYQPPPHARGD